MISHGYLPLLETREMITSFVQELMVKKTNFTTIMLTNSQTDTLFYFQHHNFNGYRTSVKHRFTAVGETEIKLESPDVCLVPSTCQVTDLRFSVINTSTPKTITHELEIITLLILKQFQNVIDNVM